MGAMQRMDFLQADNQMSTFAKETGGMAFFPRFYGEFPSIYQTIQQALRNQYSLAYAPTNAAHDGKFRKIKVELVNPATNEPLRVTDEKGKPSNTRSSPRPGTTRRAKWNEHRVRQSEVLSRHHEISSSFAKSRSQNCFITIVDTFVHLCYPRTVS